MNLLTEQAKQAAREMLPEHMIEGLFLYYEHGIRPGGFLTSVLANDLVGAINRADRINRRYIENWVEWLCNYPPGRPNAWGSYEAVEEHIASFADKKP